MRRNKTYITMMLLVAVVMLGIGYAAIAAINLQVNGSASAEGNTENFKVKFITEADVTPTAAVNIPDATVTDYVTNVTADNLTATFTVANFDTAGQTATMTYTIRNESEGINAALAVGTIKYNTTENSNDYFNVTAALDNTVIAPEGTAILTVTVALTKTPIDTVGPVTITIPVTATPQEIVGSPAD